MFFCFYDKIGHHYLADVYHRNDTVFYFLYDYS